MSGLQKTAAEVREIIDSEVSKATFEYVHIEIAARNLEDFFRREGIDPYRYIVMELKSNPSKGRQHGIGSASTPDTQQLDNASGGRNE